MPDQRPLLSSRPAAADAWRWLAALALLLATLYALAVVIFRLPFFVGASPRLFRTALALHVELAVFVFLAATMAGQWAAHCPSSPSRRALLPPLLAALGTSLLACSPLAGGQPAMLDYFPVLTGNPLFAAGFGLICLGVLKAALAALASRTLPKGLRLSAGAVLMAALATLLSALRGPAGLADLAWAGGHTLLFAHVLMMGHEWTIHGHRPAAEARTPLRLLAAGSALMPMIPLFYAPGSDEFRALYTYGMSALLWPPALWLLWTISRRPAAGTSRLEASILHLSFALFVAGCLLGALIDAPTTLVTAHYHATMGAVAISRMGMAYRGQSRIAPPAARRQLLTYTLGLALLAGGLALAAIEAAPRKTAASELVAHGPWFVTGMSISGLGGIVAMIGTVWWVFHLLLNQPLTGLARRRSGA